MTTKGLVKYKRKDRERYYRGVIIGRQTFQRETTPIFNQPARTYTEDRLLVKMSDGKHVQVWKSDTFDIVPEKKR